ncbi:MAG: cytochrome c-type biogenesis protein [Methylohalobius sp. ZOD2]
MTFTLPSLFLALFLNLLIAPAWAGIEVREFPDPQLEARYQDLIEELRCLVCQNQSLADSKADLAEDLRDEVYTMLMAGKDDREIIDFLVNRYGDFVLYRPPVKTTTALLWFGPFIALLGGIFILWFLTRKRRPETPTALNEEERRRLDSLLKDRQDNS